MVIFKDYKVLPAVAVHLPIIFRILTYYSQLQYLHNLFTVCRRGNRLKEENY